MPEKVESDYTRNDIIPNLLQREFFLMSLAGHVHKFMRKYIATLNSGKNTKREDISEGIDLFLNYAKINPWTS